MANVVTVATPTAIVVTGAAASTVPYRFTATHARIFIAGQVAVVGPGTGTSLSVTVPDLSRLTQFDQLLNADGTPSMRFIGIWQTMCEQIEGAFTALSTQVSDNTALLNRIANAQDLAQNAATTARTVNESGALEKSYTDNPVNPLSASNTGVITIAAHERIYVYADIEEAVSINAGTISSLSNETKYWVYYQDSARAGGTVNFQASTNPVAQTGNVNVVGTITIPASGAVDSSGTSPAAPGAIDPQDADFYESLNPRGTYTP